MLQSAFDNFSCNVYRDDTNDYLCDKQVMAERFGVDVAEQPQDVRMNMGTVSNWAGTRLERLPRDIVRMVRDYWASPIPCSAYRFAGIVPQVLENYQAWDNMLPTWRDVKRAVKRHETGFASSILQTYTSTMDVNGVAVSIDSLEDTLLVKWGTRTITVPHCVPTSPYGRATLTFVDRWGMVAACYVESFMYIYGLTGAATLFSLSRRLFALSARRGSRTLPGRLGRQSCPPLYDTTSATPGVG